MVAGAAASPEPHAAGLRCRMIRTALRVYEFSIIAEIAGRS
jgi:hypothetical protein